MEGTRKLFDVIVFKASWYETAMSVLLPRLVPFISMKRRVVLRSFFRDRWRRRMHKELVSALKDCYADNPLPLESWTEDSEREWSWEVSK